MNNHQNLHKREYMKKFVSFLVIATCLASCDHIGSTKIKNLIDLTPKLEIESNKAPKITEGKEDPYSLEKQKNYTISKNAIISEPAIAKKVVYTIDRRGYVSAFSIKEKKILWTTDIAADSAERKFHDGGILYSNGKLYVTNGSRYLVTLDAGNGREVIRKEFPDIVRAKPVMATKDLLLVQTISNQLIAYNVESSKFIWMHEGGIETISAKNQVHPVIHDNSALVSYSSGEVVYLDVHSGIEKWRYTLSSLGDSSLPNFEPSAIVTLPIISENFAYFATSTGKIIKLNLQTGSPVWIRDAENIQSMALHQGNLFVTSNARQIASISADDGKVNWTGALISEKERGKKKPKPALFQAPFISKSGEGFAVNVVANNGEIYKFITDINGNLSSKPAIISIDKGVRYNWISCCSGKMHLITDKNIKF
jgi:outer membrane protein assembly factor BamB